MKNWITLFVMTLVVLATPLLADTNSGFSGSCEDPCCPQTSQCDCCGQFGVHADYLYWCTCVERLCFATINTSTGNSPEIDTQRSVNVKRKGKNLCINNEWDSGFRIGATYHSVCNCWDFGIDWIQFTPSKTKSACAEANQTLEFNNIEVNEVKAKWSLDLDVVDAVIGRTICIGPCFSLRPYGGLRYASIDQRLRVDAQGEGRLGSANGDTPRPNGITTVFEKTNRSELDLLGPRIGIGATWAFDCDLKLFVDGAIALLFGDQELKENEVDSAFQDGTFLGQFISIFDFVDDECTIPVSDLAIGLEWERTVCDYDFVVKIAWEHHYFSDIHFLDRDDFTNLSTQGLTLAFSVGF